MGATPLSFTEVRSVHPALDDATPGDVFQRTIHFWLLFLPIEKAASVDSALKRDVGHPKRRTEWIRATAATAGAS